MTVLLFGHENPELEAEKIAGKIALLSARERRDGRRPVQILTSSAACGP